MLKVSKVKQKLKDGIPVFGTFVKVSDAAVIELLGHIGFDFAIIDNEHVAMNDENVTNLLRASDAAGIESIIRIRSDETTKILKALDSGAAGIQVPNVDTEDQVRGIIDGTFYYSKGKRGFATTNRAAGYGLMDRKAYVDMTNSETIIVCHCETKESVNNLEQLASYPEIDAFFIGPMDMTQSVGVIGDPSDNRVKEVISRAITILKEKNKPFGTVVWDMKSLQYYMEMGISYVVLSSDLGFMMKEAVSLLDQSREMFRKEGCR